MDLSKLSDEELASYMQRGNGKEIEHIIDRYDEPLLRYVRYLTKDIDTSQDIVQETFLSVYQNINSFDTKKKFSSWIYRIAHNKAINSIKKKSKIISLGEREIVDEKDDASRIDKKLDMVKTRRIVGDAVEKLPIKYREVIVLRYYEEKSYEEISDICRCPVSTVGVRIRRATEIMKRGINIDNIEEYL
jgi:RNA polymerase sigma-70 factor (ECF subfamily)